MLTVVMLECDDVWRLCVLSSHLIKTTNIQTIMNVGMEQILNWETIPGPFINYSHHTKT